MDMNESGSTAPISRPWDIYNSIFHDYHQNASIHMEAQARAQDETKKVSLKSAALIEIRGLFRDLEPRTFQSTHHPTHIPGVHYFFHAVGARFSADDTAKKDIAGSHLTQLFEEYIRAMHMEHLHQQLLYFFLLCRDATRCTAEASHSSMRSVTEASGEQK